MATKTMTPSEAQQTVWKAQEKIEQAYELLAQADHLMHAAALCRTTGRDEQVERLAGSSSKLMAEVRDLKTRYGAFAHRLGKETTEE